MTPGEFAAIEARAQRAQHARTEAEYARRYGVGVAESHLRAADASALDIPRLLAVLRERDNTIAKVRDVLEDYDHLGIEAIPTLSTRAWMHELRTALDPQETP